MAKMRLRKLCCFSSAGMSRGKPARDTSIRPQASLLEERGGCGIAEFEKVGIHASCELPRLRQNQQGMAGSTASLMRRKSKVRRRLQTQMRKRQNKFNAFRSQIHLLSVMCWHIALLITNTALGAPTVLRDEVVNSDISHASPARAEAYPLCRSAIAS